jgi:serine/threonine protein kinase
MDASLLDISRAEGAALPEDALAAIALPVLHGLVYMHREKHLIHRDIKPSNLLVDASGNVKIAGACSSCPPALRSIHCTLTIASVPSLTLSTFRRFGREWRAS